MRQIIATLVASALATGALGRLGAQASASSQQPAAGSSYSAQQTITFDDAIRIALRQSASVLQAENSSALDANSVRAQRLAFLPNLQASATTSQGYGRGASATAVNVNGQSATAGVSSSVTLFDGLKNVASLRSAQLTEEAGKRDLSRTRQTAVFTVASNFLSLATAQEQLRVQRENLAALEAQEEQIQKYVDAGVKPISDLYQQQASVAAARAAVVRQQQAVALAKVDLIQTLRLDAAGTYEFEMPAVSDSAAGSAQYDLDSLLARAYANRSDLVAQASRASAARQDVKAAAASKWPTVSLSVGYNTSYSSGAEPSLADQLGQRRGGTVAVGISIPLWDRGSADLAAQRAQIEEDNARLALDTQRQQVALEVRRAYLDYESAREQLAAARAQQRAAELALTTTQQRYQAGAATLVEVTQARAAQVQAASALVSARYALVFQQALMPYYTGELDPQRVTIG